MKIVNVIIGLFLLLGSPILSAQQEGYKAQVRLAGVVFDKESTTPLQNVTCWNKDSYTTTDRLGRFAMHAEVGDTVSFTHVGYQSYFMIVPDSLNSNDYMVAVALPEDTLELAEVIVTHRFGEKEREMSINARNNVISTRRDAFSSTSEEMTKSQNQRRILAGYAASTNKGHVYVGFAVGTGSWRAIRAMRTANKVENEPQHLLSTEEIDLVKMIFQYNRKEK